MAWSTSRLRPISEVWEWQLLGRCRDRSASQFFHPDDDPGHSRRRREAAAKRVCHSCPVRRQCATHALTLGEEYGVWGGFSENERIRLRRLEWQDTLDQHGLADLETLEHRLAKARRSLGHEATGPTDDHVAAAAHRLAVRSEHPARDDTPARSA